MVRPRELHVGDCHWYGHGIAPAADEVPPVLCLQRGLRDEHAGSRPVVLLLLPTERVQGADDRNDDAGQRLSPRGGYAGTGADGGTSVHGEGDRGRGGEEAEERIRRGAQGKKGVAEGTADGGSRSEQGIQGDWEVTSDMTAYAMLLLDWSPLLHFKVGKKRMNVSSKNVASGGVVDLIGARLLGSYHGTASQILISTWL